MPEQESRIVLQKTNSILREESLELQKKNLFEAIIAMLLKKERDDLVSDVRSLREIFNTFNMVDPETETEMKNDELIDKFLESTNLSSAELHSISLKLYYLQFLANLQLDQQFLNELKFLNRTITKNKIFASEEYLLHRHSLERLKSKVKTSDLDGFYQGVISTNAALSSGTAVYLLATTFVLSAPVILLSGVISTVMCGFIANYFFNSFKDENSKLTNQLAKLEQTINHIARGEAIYRLRCYSLITQIIKLNEEFKEVLNNKSSDPIILALLASWSEATSITLMDNYINSRISEKTTNASTIEEINNIHYKQTHSIYTEAFHSNWGPVISFLSATGTIFSVVKTIVELVGVVAIASSPILLLSTILMGSVALSFAFALMHRRINLASNECINEVKHLKKEVGDLEIKFDKLKRTRYELLLDFINFQRLILRNNLEVAKPELALKVEEKITKNLSLSINGSYAGSRLTLFQAPFSANDTKLSTERSDSQRSIKSVALGG